MAAAISSTEVLVELSKTTPDKPQHPLNDPILDGVAKLTEA